ncbi:SdrD B-like domain-containing protein [Rosenbergiella epipactidis]|uniref:SdrD B-like domain-containing protein n=1 Tax=Rosenbergiella epipactidis TaxID=1544694 RepID=UPI001F4D6496|nr:SdrD B-like domain-containing protein [Rosenbergiella epipactidis]
MPVEPRITRLLPVFYTIVVISLMSFCSVARATEAQCAEIRFSLSQQASFERQAFDARLTLHNASPLPLTDVKVDLQFLDSQLQPVQASTLSLSSQASFFYQLLEPKPEPSTVTAQQSTTLHWQIIPTRGAALRTYTQYHLAAKVSYTQGDRREELDVKPVMITVKPLPELSVDYFLPHEVYGDDPFTDEIEPPVPFMLGVRVINTGASPSVATTIESAQPIIRENKQHLLTQWKLLATQVGTQPAERRMQLNLGDIEPDKARVGRWLMTSQLSGKFTDFIATIRHGEALGGELTSLIKQTRHWALLHDVQDTRAGRDDILDFLVIKGDGLHLFASEGGDAAVSDVSLATTTRRNDQYLTLSLPASSQFRYVKITDPWKGKKALFIAYRGDGEILPRANVWLSKTRNEQRQWQHSINLFLAPGGQEKIIIQLSSPPPANSASLTGKVFYDTNTNGLVDKGERGVAQLPITLEGIDSQGRQWQQRMKTDRAGQFSFDKLLSGTWRVHTGYLNGFVDGKSSPGSASGHAVAGEIRDIALSAGEKVTQLLFAKQAADQPDLGRADLEAKWLFPPIMAQSYQPWVAMLVVSNRSSQPATDVRVHLPWPTRSITPQKSRSWSITQGVLAAESSRWQRGEWHIGDMAATSQRVLVVEGIMRLSARPQSVNFFAQVGSQSLDDNLNNNVAQRLIVVSERQPNSPLNFDMNQWIEQQLAELTRKG